MLTNVCKLSFEKQVKYYKRNGLGDNGREVQVKLLGIVLINYDILYAFFSVKLKKKQQYILNEASVK